MMGSVGLNILHYFHFSFLIKYYAIIYASKLREIFIMSTSTNKQRTTTTTTLIAGKKVKIATKIEVKAIMEKIKRQYTKTLDNLKNR